MLKHPDERGLTSHYKKNEKVFEKKSVINRKCFQRLQVGPRAAGVHQVSEGDHEQQGRAAQPVRPQGGADPAGQVHLPHHPPRHARGSQADGRRVPRPPGRPRHGGTAFNHLFSVDSRCFMKLKILNLFSTNQSTFSSRHNPH